MLQSPLEQFQLVALAPINIFNLDFSITNFLVINILVIVSILAIVCFNSLHIDKLTFHDYYIPNSWEKGIEIILETSSQIVSEIITINKENYLPIIFVLFNFILLTNVTGLIPYSFTATSHIIVTFTLSFSMFIGINITFIEKYSQKAFSLFLPANSNFFLALLLVPIELMSYIAKPISLGVRLFINLMAGHTLLKVIIGFSWNILYLQNVISIGALIPLILVIILFGLELGVALIQAYVFTILSCIYIQNAN